MKTSVSTACATLAYGTLIVDAYLALASVASRVGVRNLPPFGAERATNSSLLLVMTVATWTAILALGTLRGQTGAAKTYETAFYWFLLVLALAWIGLLIPLVKTLF